jgi:multiple sugar transport system substrate-binding protein
MWLKDPKMTVFRDEPKYGVPIGYPGPPNEKVAMSWSKYIVVDIFARAVQSGDAKGAVDWGVEQPERVYGI